MTRVTAIIAIIAAFLAVAPQLAAAQGLAEVAKAEEARRKAVKTSARTYTNVDLQPDFTTPTTPTSSAARAGSASAEAAAPATAATVAPGAAPVNIPLSPDPADASAAIAGVPGTEAQWRNRITSARATLDRSRMFAEALQSRINALTTDVINRDDPYQRGALEQDRQKALAELERVRKEMESQAQGIAAIEEEARRAGVPPGWLR